MNQKNVLLAIMMWLSHAAVAQTISSSPYSVYGIGILNERSSSLSRALGGTGIGVQSDNSLNPVNPASYGSILSPISHVYEIGFNMESNRYQTTDRSESKSTGGLNNINYWFKFKPWWAASAGLAPFSSVSYDIQTKRNLGAAETDYSYSGSGNINQVYLGNAFTITKNLSLGVHASYLFGSIARSETIALTDGTSLTLENQIVARKLHVDYGLQYKFNLNQKRSIVIGVVADNGLTINGKVTSSLYDQYSDTLSSSEGASKKYSLPKSVGLGVSYQTQRHLFASDLKFENWSSASLPDVTTQDTWRFSAGYVYKGKPNAETYWDLISLHTGFYAQNYHIHLKGNKLPEWGLSMSISIPVFDGKSSINLSYLYDQIGTTNDNLILQRSQKIMLDVVIRDLWGVKRKFD